MVNINVIGRLAAEAESKKSSKGTDYVQFRIGVDNYANGKQETAWFSVMSATEQAVRIAKYLTKGRQVHVHGTESVRLFTTKTGETGIGRDILAYSIDFVNGGQRKEDATTTTTTTTATVTAQPTIAIPTAQPAMVASTSSDDDLPF